MEPAAGLCHLRHWETSLQMGGRNGSEAAAPGTGIEMTTSPPLPTLQRDLRVVYVMHAEKDGTLRTPLPAALAEQQGRQLDRWATGRGVVRCPRE